MKKKRRGEPSGDDILQFLCVVCNTTWPQEDKYLAEAAAEKGMTVEAFQDLADEVKFALLRGEAHPQAAFVDGVQQRAFRIKEEEEPLVVELRNS